MKFLKNPEKVRKRPPKSARMVKELNFFRRHVVSVICETLTKGLEDAGQYAREIKIISIMKMDYELLEKFIEDLEKQDSQMLKASLVKKMYIKEIAAETGMSYDFTKRRLKALREEISLEVTECIAMNCREVM